MLPSDGGAGGGRAPAPVQPRPDSQTSSAPPAGPPAAAMIAMHFAPAYHAATGQNLAAHPNPAQAVQDAGIAHPVGRGWIMGNRPIGGISGGTPVQAPSFSWSSAAGEARMISELTGGKYQVLPQIVTPTDAYNLAQSIPYAWNAAGVSSRLGTQQGPAAQKMFQDAFKERTSHPGAVATQEPGLQPQDPLGLQAQGQNVLSTIGLAKPAAPQNDFLATLAPRVAGLMQQPGEAGIRNAAALQAAGYPFPGDLAKQLAQWSARHANTNASGVPLVSVLSPDMRSMLLDAVRATGNPVPPAGASDSQIIAAVHHAMNPDGGLLGTLGRIPQSATAWTVGLPMGLAEIGHGAWNALHGDPRLAEHIASSLGSYYAGVAQHPIAALQRDPVGTVLNVGLPAWGGIGSVGGRVARAGVLGDAAQAFAAMRRPDLPIQGTSIPGSPVTPPQVSHWEPRPPSMPIYETHPFAMGRPPVPENIAAAIQRSLAQPRLQAVMEAHPGATLPGTGQVLEASGRPALSPALTTRAVQVFGDRLVGANVAGLGDRALARQASRNAQEFHESLRSVVLPAVVKPVQAARAAMTPAEQAAAIHFAQGVTPNMMRAFYETLPASKDVAARLAQVDQAIKAGHGDVPSPAIERWHAAAQAAVTNRERIGQSFATLQTPAVEPRRVMLQNAVLDRIGLDHPAVDAARTLPPFYVPHKSGEPIAGPGQSDVVQRAINTFGDQANTPNKLVLLNSGRLSTTHSQFEQALRSPVMIEHQARMIDAHIGRVYRPVPQGFKYDGSKFVWTSDPSRAGFKSTPNEPISPGLAAALRLHNPAAAVEFTNRIFPHANRKGMTTTPVGEPGGLIPRAHYDALTAAMKGRQPFANPGLRLAEQATLGWRHMNTAWRPEKAAMFFANDATLGAMGGVGPTSWMRGLMSRPSVTFRGKEVIPAGRYQGLTPEILQRTGLANELLQTQRLGHAGTTAFSRLLAAPFKQLPDVVQARLKNPIGIPNVMRAHENLMNRALYLRDAVPQARAFTSQARTLGIQPAAQAALRDAATRADQAAQQLFQHGDPAAAAGHLVVAAQRLRDFSYHQFALQSPAGRVTRLVAPFYQWTAFITKLTLLTLPTKYPVRNALMNEIGQLGNDDLQRMGMLPTWLQGSIPLDTHTQANTSGVPGLSQMLPGSAQHQYTTLLNPGYLNPFSGFNQLFTTSPQGEPSLSGLSSLANPWLQAGITSVTGRDLATGRQAKNAAGEPLGGMMGYKNDPGSLGAIPSFEAALQQMVQATPVVNLAAQGAGILHPNAQNLKTGLQEPQQTWWQKALYNATGVNLRQYDLTLNQLKDAYYNIQPPKGTPNVPWQVHYVVNMMRAQLGAKQAQAYLRLQQVLKNLPARSTSPGTQPSVPYNPNTAPAYGSNLPTYTAPGGGAYGSNLPTYTQP